MILPQGDLPHDPGILHTVAQLNMRDVGNFGTLPCAGVYADVVKPGTIRRGDTVHYLGAWADDPVVATGRADQVIE